MASLAGIGDLLSRSLFPKPLVDQAIKVKYKHDGAPVVYQQRWYVLIAFCMGYFTWAIHTYRINPLVSEYALYYGQPNEFQGFPNVGIDFLTIFESVLLLVLYPVGGILVDKYGLQVMVYGAIGQAIACWWWFLSFDNYTSVVLTRVLSNLSGACTGSSLLRVSNNWFAEDQRALAVAIGALVGSLGGGAALLVSPLFVIGDDLINLDLLSCRAEDLEAGGLDLNNLPRECNDVAEEAFCCAADTNLDGLNFFMAILTSLVAVYTFFTVTDAPPTPPSRSGVVRKGPPFKTALKLMFSKSNYAQICLTDFVSSGPPLVLFSTIDRIFPAAVSEYSSFTASAGFVLAIPIGAYFSLQLARTRMFYEITTAGYVTGFMAWTLGTILVFIDTEVADYIFVAVGGCAIICFVLWTVAVYELKMEYVFSPDFALQGYVVAIDRTVINLSATLFLLAIPPERYTGSAMTGRQFTFLIGAIFMGIGVLLVLSMPFKRRYLRKHFEEEEGISVGEILDENLFYPIQERKSQTL